MNQTLAVLVPWLQFLAGGGSGVLASWMFDRLRASRPLETIPAGHWLATALYAPRYARLIVLVLGAVVSVAATVLVALLTAGDLPAVLDSAVAAAVSGVASQLTHARHLETTPPPTPPTITMIGKPPELSRFAPDPVLRTRETIPEARHGSAGPAVPYRSDPEAETFAGVDHGITIAYDGPERRNAARSSTPRGPDRRKGSRSPENMIRRRPTEETPE